MKATQVVKPKEEGTLIRPQLCICCGKMLQAPYGRHNTPSGVVWTCSTRCESLFKLKGG